MVNAMQALPVDSAAEHEVVVRTGGDGHRRVRRGRRLRARSAGRGSRAHLRAVLLDEGDRRRHRAGPVRLPQHRARPVGRRDRVGSSGGWRGVQDHRARDLPASPPCRHRHRRPRPRRATGGGSGRAPHRPGRGRRDGRAGALAAAQDRGLPRHRDSRRRDRARHPPIARRRRPHLLRPDDDRDDGHGSGGRRWPSRRRTSAARWCS